MRDVRILLSLSYHILAQKLTGLRTVGTVKLLYWSTSANETHPSTLFDSLLGYTLYAFQNPASGNEELTQS